MPKPENEIEQQKRRYRKAMDAVAAGVEMSLAHDRNDGLPKRLRFGLVAAQVSLGAMVRLLKDKGLIGEEEHLEALAEAAEAEKASYENLLTARYGREVKL